MSGTRDENVFMARLAEQAERYEDMVEYMKRVANMGSELCLEERNLLSVAYKNAVGCRRSAWRSISALMGRDALELAKTPETQQAVSNYKKKVEGELNEKCLEILGLLGDDMQAGSLVASASLDDAKVFFLKMQGDYYRYLAEFSENEQQQTHAGNANCSYAAAFNLAKHALPPTHPIRLGLALNFSVFYFEVMGKPDQACQLARESFDSAISQMEMLDEEQYKDSATIMQLLKDNLTLWQSDSSMGGDGMPTQQDGTVVEDF